MGGPKFPVTLEISLGRTRFHPPEAGSPSSRDLGLGCVPTPLPRPAAVLSSQSVILVPLEVRGGHRHGFAAQEGGPAQGRAGTGHVRDGGRIWEGRESANSSELEMKGFCPCPPPPSFAGVQNPLPPPQGLPPFRARCQGAHS